MNNDIPTWCSSDASSRSILDLVFISHSLAIRTRSIKLLLRQWPHFRKVENRISLYRINPLSSHHSNKQGRLGSFSESCENKKYSNLNIYNPLGKEVYNNYISQIKEAVLQAGGKYCRETVSIKSFPTSPWWNPDCVQLKEKKKELYKKLTSNTTIANINAFNEYSKETKKQLTR